MIIWLDAQLPPGLARWLKERFGLEALALRDLGLRDAPDSAIFSAARSAQAVLMSKDADFVGIVERLAPPPHLIWLTCGNVTNRRLQTVLDASLFEALMLIRSGQPIVEIGDKHIADS